MSQRDSLGNSGEKGTSEQSAAPRAAASAESLLAAWNQLPPHARRCILAIVDASESLTEAQVAAILCIAGEGGGE